MRHSTALFPPIQSRRYLSSWSLGLLLALIAGGLSLPTLPEAKNPRASAAPADQAPMADQGVDLHGDPLPQGAAMRLGTLQRRAVGAQWTVSADGSSIVTVRGGKYVRIWDAATARLLQQRELPVGVSALSALSPDGRWLATDRWGPDQNMTIWDVRSGKMIRELLLKDAGAIAWCAFAPDGRKLMLVGRRSEECFVRVWNWTDGKLLFRKFVPAAANHLAAIAPDGKHVVAQFFLREGNVSVYCWEIDSGRQLWRSKDFRLERITFTPDGKLLSWRPDPQAVDLATGRSAKIALPKGASKLSHLALAPDGRTLLVFDPFSFGDAIVWDWKKSEQLRVLKGVGEAVFLPDGKSIISNNGALQRWDVASGAAAWPDTFALGHTSAVDGLAFTADGQRLVSGSWDGSVRLWDVKTGRPLAVWGGYHRPPGLAGGSVRLSAPTLTPDGNHLLCGSQQSILLRDTQTGERIRSFSLPRLDEFSGSLPVYRFHLSLDGTKILGLAGTEYFSSYLIGARIPTNWLAVWDLKSGRLLTRRRVPWTAKALSPDGRQVLLADGVLIDGDTGKEIARMEGMSERDDRGTFSSNGALIVSRVTYRKDSAALITDRVRVWETATGKVVADFKPKADSVGLVLAMDSRFLVLNDSDSLKIWDLFHGEIVAGRRIRMPEEVPSFYGSPRGRFALSRDGRHLAASSSDSTILLWDMPALRTKRRSLTAKECEALWTDLADADAAKAWRAVWRLADAPDEALSFLRGRLKPYPTAPVDVTRKLLADLDDDSYARRETAEKRLKELRLQVEPALRATLKAKPSLEQRRRIEMILAALPQTPPPLTMEELRQLRALIVLECIDSPEARRVLADIAKGPESVRLTHQARASLRYP